jgi:hypothetical protein
MDKEAVFNRCLLDATGLASTQCESVGDVACYRRVRDAVAFDLTVAAPAFIVSVTTVANPASTSTMSSAIA